LEGAVQITFIDGYAPAAGARFDLFDVGGAFTPGALSLFNSPPGLEFLPSFADDVFSITAVQANGDFNGDGKIDAADLALWQAGFGNLDAELADGDADGDQDVDGSDFLVWQRRLGSTATSSSANAAIPEPSSVLLAAFVIAAFIPRRASAFTLFAAAISMASTHAVARGSIVASWGFEEGAPNVAAAGANSILDSTGNALNGTPVLGPVYRSVISPYGALGLEFTGGNQRVFVPDSLALALTQSLTLEAFIRYDGAPSGTVGFTQIVFRGDDRGALDPYFLAVNTAGQLVFHVENQAGADADLFSPMPISQGVFMHVAGTLDDATGVQRLFINGVEVATQVTSIRPFGTLTGSNPGIGIGNLQSALLRQGFDGVIDFVQISNEARDFVTDNRGVPEAASWLTWIALLGLSAVRPLTTKARCI
jgi:hypothetical protein